MRLAQEPRALLTMVEDIKAPLQPRVAIGDRVPLGNPISRPVEEYVTMVTIWRKAEAYCAVRVRQLGASGMIGERTLPAHVCFVLPTEPMRPRTLR